MSKVALAVAVGSLALFGSLGFRDPLAAANLTAAERRAGLLSADLEVNGANCRFCRIHVERTLEEIPGVHVAKADMSHHRARVVYDPALVEPADLSTALRSRGPL